jgi:type VI secretion system secreted protein Hcp
MAAVDYFLKLDGIKGESQDAKHKGEIDIMAFSVGLAQLANLGSGGGGGTGKVKFEDITISKVTDTSSTTLALFCANGKHIKDALITCRKAGENPVEYLKIKLTDVIVSGVQFGGHHEGQVAESVTLAFGKINMEYAAQDSKGVGTAAGSMGWDVAANQKI